VSQAIISVHITSGPRGRALAFATHAGAWQGSLGPQSASVLHASSLFFGAGSLHTKGAAEPASEATGELATGEVATGDATGVLAVFAGAGSVTLGGADALGPLHAVSSAASGTRRARLRTIMAALLPSFARGVKGKLGPARRLRQERVGSEPTRPRSVLASAPRGLPSSRSLVR
jgi:hypothetical protein